MFQQLVQGFMQSRQGQTAFSKLQAQGFSPQQSQGFLSAAVPTAAQAFHNARTGGTMQNRPGGPEGLLDVGNSHYVTNFLSGAVSGLIRGHGIVGAAVDGAQGVAGGHVAQVIASRFGLPQRVAGTVGAIVTPLVIDWLWERVNGGSLDLGNMFGGGASAGGMAGGLANLIPGMGGGGAAPFQNMGGGGGWGGGGGSSPAGGVSPTVQGGIQGGLGALFGQLMGGGNR